MIDEAHINPLSSVGFPREPPVCTVSRSTVLVGQLMTLALLGTVDAAAVNDLEEARVIFSALDSFR